MAAIFKMAAILLRFFQNYSRNLFYFLLSWSESNFIGAYGVIMPYIFS